MSNKKEETKIDNQENLDEGEADAQMEPEGEGEIENDVEDPEAENEGEDDVPVYVEKDFAPRIPYESEFKEENLKEVEELTVKNTRKTLKVRVSRRK